MTFLVKYLIFLVEMVICIVFAVLAMQKRHSTRFGDGLSKFRWVNSVLEILLLRSLLLLPIAYSLLPISYFLWLAPCLRKDGCVSLGVKHSSWQSLRQQSRKYLVSDVTKIMANRIKTSISNKWTEHN